MAVAAPLGGERRRLALEDPPQLEEVVHVRVLVEREDETEGALERVRCVGDDEGAAVRRRDHALRLEHPQRLADGGAADVEALRQLAFGRQRVARLQPARADLAEQLLGDLDVDLATLDGLVARGLLHLGEARWSDKQTTPRGTLRRPASEGKLRRQEPGTSRAASLAPAAAICLTRSLSDR